MFRTRTNGPPAGGPGADPPDEALRAGDPAAWRRLFAEHYDAVFRYAFLATGSLDAAGDVASAVFTDAVQQRRDFRGPPLPRLLRLAQQHARRRARTRRTATGFLGPAAVEAPRPLAGSLDLEPEQAALVALRMIERRPVADIARTLQRDERDVLNLQERALRSIAARMEPQR